LTFFKIKCHAVRAAGLTPKSFFIFCIFKRECRATRAID